MIVDDDAFNHFSLGSLLETKFKLKIDHVFNGQEAVLKMVREHNTFKLIIMDLNMPVLNGMEATLKMRQLEQEGIIDLSRTKIYLHSAVADSVTNTSMFDGVFSKPIDIKQMAVVFSHLFEIKVNL